ncbi:MAG: type I-C CRISPR-associated protein Cas8c/Csd1 [Ruminococcus sp.]|nr:type I-C CRISPR-associated protein Cas8c/Csd1 [Ruminococcus sp.]
MSWMNALSQIYDLNVGVVGKRELVKVGNQEKFIVLLPLYHSTQKAQLEVVIYSDASFACAKAVDEVDSETIIPTTEDSAFRSSGIAPHPLCDKLIYVAGDYSEYVKSKKSTDSYFENYINGLSEWVHSEHSHPLIKIIYDYLKQGTLIKDLIEEGLLQIGADGKHLDEKYKISKIAQAECFVRFVVRDSQNHESYNVWESKELYNSFIEFENSRHKDVDLCYVSGERKYITYKHSSKIRNTGDKAKLLSSNDKTNFTYLGRFKSDKEAYAVSREVSQKAHLALRWLIERQGITIGSAKYLFWESEMNDVVEPDENLFQKAIAAIGIKLEDDKEELPVTNAEYARIVAYRLKGYRTKLNPDSKIMFLCVDAATTGRLSLVNYQEFSATYYYDKLEKWYNEVVWRGSYIKESPDGNKKHNQRIFTDFYTPIPKEIVKYAYGIERSTGNLEVDDKLFNIIYRNIMDCIIYETPLSESLIKKLYERCASPQKYSDKYNNWNRLMDVACAVFRKYYIDKIGVEFNLAVDKNCTDRSYLYGRLVAVADKMELDTYKNGEARLTNAKRYMSAMLNSPFKTWKYINERILPYNEKILKTTPSFYFNYEKVFCEIYNSFDQNDFESNKELDARFFMGFYSQQQEFYTSKNNKDKDTEEK